MHNFDFRCEVSSMYLNFVFLLLAPNKHIAMLEGFHQEEMLGKKRKEWMIKEGDEKIG